MVRLQLLDPTVKLCSLSVLLSIGASAHPAVLSSGPSWQIRSSSRRKRARPKMSAPQLVLATVIFFQLRAICSISSNRRTLFRPGSDGRRYFYGLKVFTERARQRVATRPLSSKPFARHCELPNEFGFQQIATVRVS